MREVYGLGKSLSERYEQGRCSAVDTRPCGGGHSRVRRLEFSSAFRDGFQITRILVSKTPAIHNRDLFVQGVDLLLHLENHGSQIRSAAVIQFRRKLLHAAPPVTFSTRIIPKNSFLFNNFLLLLQLFGMFLDLPCGYWA